MLLTNFLVILIFISGLAHIISHYLNKRKYVIFFKTLTTSLLFTLSIFITQEYNFYHKIIILGLFFSWFGDVFLLFPEKKFIHGLVSFLLAHICYIIAFAIGVEIKSFLYLLPLVIYGILMFAYLKKNLGSLKIPVIVYISIIMLMVFFSFNRYLVMGTLSLFIGSLFFMLSDSVLAINKFAKKFHAAEFIILSTYYLSQVLIIFSVK